MDMQDPSANYMQLPSGGGEKPHMHKQYGFFVAVCFAFNFCVGVGILAIPQAFATAGIWFGLAVICLSCFFITIAAIWVIETSKRALAWAAIIFQQEQVKGGENFNYMPNDDAESVESLDENEHSNHVLRLRSTLHSSVDAVRPLLEEYSPEVAANEATALVRTAQDEGSEGIYRATYTAAFEPANVKVALGAVGHRMFEMNELLDIFCPTWAKIMYELALYSFLWMALWSYTSVFGTSMVNKFPIFDASRSCNSDHYTHDCESSFRLYVLFYAIIVIWLTLKDFTEMVLFQVFLTICRFLVIAVFILTSLIGLYHDPVDNHPHASYAENKARSTPYLGDYELWDWKQIASILSAVVFAQLLNFGLPSILTPFNDKSQAKKVTIIAIICTSIFYATVGLSTALYFGQLLNGQINLNYQHYRGNHYNTYPGWAHAISYYATLFPAVDVLSMFPLLATSLGNSIQAFAIRYSRTAQRLHKKGKTVKYASKVFACIPPICCAFGERNLSTIVKYACIPCLWIAFVAPGCMQFFSRKRCRELGVSERTPESGWYSGKFGLIIVGIFTSVCYVLMCGVLADKNFLGKVN